MIAKKYRLTERQVKKVLQKWKPFFTQGFVCNLVYNKFDYNRYAIVIWWKSVQNAVSRNFFRRLFYGIVDEKLLEWVRWYDIVLLVKKQTKLDRIDEKNVANFQKDIHFLLHKVLKHTWNN